MFCRPGGEMRARGVSVRRRARRECDKDAEAQDTRGKPAGRQAFRGQRFRGAKRKAKSTQRPSFDRSPNATHGAGLVIPQATHPRAGKPGRERTCGESPLRPMPDGIKFHYGGIGQWQWNGVASSRIFRSGVPWIEIGCASQDISPQDRRQA